MPSPTVSVVMPAYNAEKTIRQSIDSVLRQTFTDWELIAVNDGSKDSTVSIVEEFSRRDPRIILHTLSQNGGLPNARNQGCLRAQGKFVAFLDSDDLWHKDKLKTQMSFHNEHPSIKISHTDFQIFDEKKVFKRPYKKFVESRAAKEGQLYPTIAYENTVGVLTVMVDRELLKDVGLFDTSLWTFEDQELWLRIARKNVAFGYIDKVLAYYRLTHGGMSRRLGRYKKAYKFFIKNYLRDEKLDQRRIWKNYFHHFGTAYFHKGDFQLAKLYFKKSLSFGNVGSKSITSLLYLLFATLKDISANKS
jgi:teichuronic acid biosynthesis glycosyltransferase TuaG